ncbi:hypothetical protein L6452_05942 [Arctium lappa]|uniref:Uncharacterized protein n=1 Tax=Arctium lappa TaxID=4217 RepID=A0ACB9EIU8_ARCLA|nr:hypothetical protein L6452_05942 [Arctium lappa]
MVSVQTQILIIHFGDRVILEEPVERLVYKNKRSGKRILVHAFRRSESEPSSRNHNLNNLNSDIIVQDLTIRAPVDSPNTDGIDPGLN